MRSGGGGGNVQSEAETGSTAVPESQGLGVEREPSLGSERIGGRCGRGVAGTAVRFVVRPSVLIPPSNVILGPR